MSMRLVDAGSVPYLRSQTIYHGVAQARTGDTPDTVILLSPDEPYVCFGLHQDINKEIDVGFCNTAGIPFVRREVGGGAVLLDSDQVFVQWIFHPDRLPRRVEARFDLFARPLVECYKSLGIQASFRPVNDIQVDGRKIGGTGAGTIGNSEVLVGNFLFDFNYKLMSKVLKAPYQKFRDTIYHSLQKYMTTMNCELGGTPSHELVKDLYVQSCENVLGEELVKGKFTENELAAMEAFDSKFASDEWLFQAGGLDRGGVKIHADVWVYTRTYQAGNGLIRLTVRKRNNFIDDISISGDFDFLPGSVLPFFEKALVDIELEEVRLLQVVTDFYQKMKISSPRVQPEDWVRAIMTIKNR